VPRKPRFNLVGIPQHLIQRGNNREPCFCAEGIINVTLVTYMKLRLNMIADSCLYLDDQSRENCSLPHILHL
jgi:REP element-mobilizing transposase RayT